MLMEKVFAVAEPCLKGRTIKDLVIGIALIACELDNGDVGLSYLLREGLLNGVTPFPFFRTIIGQSALEAAQMIVTGSDNIQRGVAASVLTAASRKLDLPNDDGSALFGVDFKKEDTIGMIGYISPVAKQLSGIIKELIVFDKGLSLYGGNRHLRPMEQQTELVPKCDIVLISGTAAINLSLDPLLELCTGAREIVLLGPSTPMFPEAYRGSRITRLAGSFWENDHKKEIFRSITLAGGISSIEKYMIKKAVAVH